MTSTTDYHPTDLEGEEERKVERRQRLIADAIEERDDIVWLMSGRRGRRQVRRQLREAKIDLSEDEVGTVFDRHHGQMCFFEGRRLLGLQLFVRITKLVASGDIPLDDFRDLLTESDE